MVDRLDFVFERWARYWLPPEEETGDRRADVDRAINRTHARIGGGTLRINTGLLVVTSASTLAVLPVEPSRPLPEWIDHRPRIDKPMLFLNGLLAAPPPPPSMLVQFSQAAVGPDDLVLNMGTVVSISTAKGAVWVNHPRTKALAALLSGLKIDLCRKALDLARRRDAGDGGRPVPGKPNSGKFDGDWIDREFKSIAEQLGIGLDRLHDILDDMIEANKTEIQTAVLLAKQAETA